MKNISVTGFELSGLEPPGCPTPGACSCNCRKEIEAENERLRAENAALKYSLQLDEDLIGKIQQIISILASRPVWTPNKEEMHDE